MKTRILTLLLSAVMLLSLFTGCGKDKKADETTTQAATQNEVIETEENEISPEIPAVSYDRTINILQRVGPYKEEWDSDAEKTDVLSDALYTRNQYLKDKYTIDFAYHNVAIGPDSNIVKASLLSDMPSYDIMTYSPLFLSSWAQSDLLAQIDDLPYVDFADPWWYGDIMEDITVDGSCYFAIGSANLCSLWTANGVLFNKTMFEQFYPGQSLYEEVTNKNWTLETMLTYAENIYADTDGISGVTADDRYGIVYAGAVWYPLFYGTGMRLATKNADGDYVVDLTSENVVNRITTIVNLCNNRDITREFNANDDKDEWFHFANGNALFLPESIAATNTCRKNMTDDYGVLPTPLLQAGQANYYAPIHPNHSSAFAIGKNIPQSDWEMLGAIITDASYMAKKVQWPALYETVLKGRTAKDNDTLEMLDILYTNLVLDPLLLYDNGNDVDNKIRALIADNGATSVYTELYALSESTAQDLMNVVNQLRGQKDSAEG